VVEPHEFDELAGALFELEALASEHRSNMEKLKVVRSPVASPPRGSPVTSPQRGNSPPARRGREGYDRASRTTRAKLSSPWDMEYQV
jgi:hypothetical protein